MSPFRFCPRCAAALTDHEGRATCPQPGCGFVHYDNPLPVVAGIVERPDGVVLVRSRDWPEKMLGLPTGFVEPREAPAAAILREVKEELDLDAELVRLVGVYGFAPQNQLIVASITCAPTGPFTGRLGSESTPGSPTTAQSG